MNLTGKKIAVTGASGTAIVKAARVAGGAVAAIDRHSATEELRNIADLVVLLLSDRAVPSPARRSRSSGEFNYMDASAKLLGSAGG